MNTKRASWAAKSRGLSALVVLGALLGSGSAALGGGSGANVMHYQVLVADQVAFDQNQSGIGRGQAQVVDLMASYLKENPEMQVTVQGHADAGERKCEELSQKRAEEVLKRLVRKGVSADRLSTEAFSNTRPVSDAADRGSRALNRRVEFYVVKIVSFEEEISFKPGSAVTLSNPPLDTIADKLSDNGDLNLRIVGYAESNEESGPDALRDLSLARARMVRDGLVQRGVATDRLMIVGGGAGPNRADHNRRVGFAIVSR